MKKIYLSWIVLSLTPIFFQPIYAQRGLDVKAAQACLASLSIGDDQYFCNTNPVTTTLVAVPMGTILSGFWLPTTGLANPNAPITQATVSQTTTYTYTAKSYDPAINLIVNGDFEQGNQFFKSGYIFNKGDLTPVGVYDVLQNPQSANPAYPPCKDHSAGSFGHMLATGPAKDEMLIWTQEVQVSPLTDYYFSGWSLRLDGPKAVLRVEIGNETFLAGTGFNCNWLRFARPVYSGGNSTLTISIYKLVTAVPSSIALDDLTLHPVCEAKDSLTIHLASVSAAAQPTFFLQPCDGKTVTLHGTGTSSGIPITYQWTTSNGNIVSGADTPDPVVDAPGTYVLTVSSADPNHPNCTSTATVVVERASTTISTWVTALQTLNCVIKQTTLTANVGFGTNVSYQWAASNGGNIIGSTTVKNVQINAPGTYSVVVTDNANGCTAEAVFEMANNTTPPNVSATAAPLNCIQQQTTLSGAGSSTGPGFTYKWTTVDGRILSGVDSLYALTDTVGTYILKVTNLSNLCVAYDTVQVNQTTALPTPALLPADTLDCFESSLTLGVDSLSYTGPQLVYLWTASPGGNIVSGADSLSPVVNAPGWYTLLVTDTLSGCTGRDSVLVPADTALIVAVANAPQGLTCALAEVQLNANGSNPDPTLFYQWTTANGNIVSGADTPTPTVNAPGTYVLVLTHPVSGCTGTDNAVVVQNTAPPPVSIGAPPPLTCALTQQTLAGVNSAPAGAFSYAWTTADGNILSGQTTLTPLIGAAGTYNLLATNTATGCTAGLTVLVNSDTQAPTTELSASGNLNCNNSEVTLTNSSSSDPTLLEHQWTNPDGSTGNTGATPTWTAAAPGAYQLLLTNTQNGCTSTASLTVEQQTAVSASVQNQTDVSCFGGADGALSVQAAGGNGAYAYAWPDGQTTAQVDNLSAGTYTVTVTDGENCSTSLSLTVNEPEALVVNASATGLSAQGSNDGTATAAPTGGAGTYTYEWHTGATSQQLTGLAGGLYTVTVTDANGCTAEETVEVFDGNCAMTVGATAVNPACYGTATGQATAMPQNGAQPFSYAWSSGATTATATGLTAGAYTVLVTDANGCTSTAAATLTDPAELSLNVQELVHPFCPGGNTGSATVAAQGGTGALLIEWSNGQQGEQATGLGAGIFTATVTDANGCQQTTTAELTATDSEPPSLSANPAVLPLGPAGSVTLTVQNLGLQVSDNCAVADVTFVPESFNCFQLGQQTVTATAIDGSGNTAALSFAVTVVDVEAPKVVCPANIVRCAGHDIVEYTAPVATDNCLMLGGFFDLMEGLPSGVQFPEGTTTTTYTYTDFSGNVGSCSFEVTILTPLEVKTDTILPDVGGQGTGGVQVTVSGSAGGYNYAWQQNGLTIATTEDLAGVGAGTYSLVVTDAQGCTKLAGPYEVRGVSGTNNAPWSALVGVFPNPTAGYLQVVLPADLVPAELYLRVYDARGRLVQEQNSRGQKQLTLDWSGLADGLYTLLLRTETGQGAFRVRKMR